MHSAKCVLDSPTIDVYFSIFISIVPILTCVSGLMQDH